MPRLPESMAPRAGRRAPRWYVAGAIAGGVALIGPVLWVIATRADRNTGDLALIELRARDVLSSRMPLAGAYSRYGWMHPGPWLYYLFALPYRAFGNDARALALTALLFNVVVVVLIVWLAARRDAATAVIAGVTIAVLVRGLPPMALADGWNVSVTTIPFVLVVVAAWRALRGDRLAAPIGTAATIFIAQAHVGVGVVVVPVFVVTLGLILLYHSRHRSDPLQVGATFAVIGLGLAPLVVDAIAHPPGNVVRLIHWSVSNDEPHLGPLGGLRMIGRSTSLSFLRDPQLPGRLLLELPPVDPGLLPGLSIVLLGGAAAIAHRRGWHEELALCSLVGFTWVVGGVALMVVTEPVGWWLVEWLQPLGWLTWMAIALVGWRLIRVVTPPHARVRTERMAVLAAALIGVVAIVDHGRATVAVPDRTAEFVRPVDELTAAARPLVRDGLVSIEPSGSPLTAQVMLEGVVARLDAFGSRPCVGAEYADKFGGDRVCDGELARRLVLRAEPVTEPAPPGTTLVVVVDPLSPEQRTELDALRERIAAVMRDVGLEDRIGLLDTPLADAVLLGDPPPELRVLTDELARLTELRRVPGVRYALYTSSS